MQTLYKGLVHSISNTGLRIKVQSRDEQTQIQIETDDLSCPLAQRWIDPVSRSTNRLTIVAGAAVEELWGGGNGV